MNDQQKGTYDYATSERTTRLFFDLRHAAGRAFEELCLVRRNNDFAKTIAALVEARNKADEALFAVCALVEQRVRAESEFKVAVAVEEGTK